MDENSHQGILGTSPMEKYSQGKGFHTGENI
jgi:hypothetical protein